MRLVSSVDSQETLTVTFGFDYFFGRQRNGNYPVPNVGRIQTTVRQAILTPELLKKTGAREDDAPELLMFTDSAGREKETPMLILLLVLILILALGGGIFVSKFLFLLLLLLLVLALFRGRF